MDTLEEKYIQLKNELRALGGVAIAFSGGVDSTLLLKAAHDALGDACIAVTVDAASMPPGELDAAKAFCAREGVRHAIAEVDLFAIAGFADNPPDRCYICKKALFGRILSLARAQGIDWIAEGSNLDDLGDYRPGMRAIAELGVRSPLRDAALTKAEIRRLSARLSLSTGEKRALACLATRFPYGQRITKQGLAAVGRAENALTQMGFTDVRVRSVGSEARIEIPPAEFGQMLARRETVIAAVKSCGFAYVALDLQGYRQGSLNETLGL